ncbi:amidohydrolase family protein [Propionibacteriaceae bacterium G57]|uniref:amidohydrolase family protein n=1 Tax=Aestuariimicrobium sp. G57 TaxID=3418485 RepID=UPI003DA724A7
MIIDAHAHWGPWFFSMETGPMATNTELLDRFGIDIQVVSAIEAINYDPASGNAALEREFAQTDDPRLFGYVVIDPRDLAQARADLARLTAPRWVGVKIHTHYTGTPIRSAAMRRAVELATDHGLPVLQHTWGPDVVDLADLANDVPGSRVIAGHMGADAWRLIPEAARRSDRIWFEPCWSQPEAGRIRWVVDQVGADRLVFGSDATLIDPSVTLGAIAAADLSEPERAAVLGGNARELLGLS